MSQFRLARISLMLAAFGLNALPALQSGAHAQAAPATPAAAPAAQPETVRKEMFALIDSAKIKTLIAEKKYAEVQEKLTAAAAMPNKTPFEIYVIDRMKISLGAATNNDALMQAGVESALASGRLPADEKGLFLIALSNIHFNAKNYPKAVETMKLYQKDSPTPEKVRARLIRAQYLNNDFAGAKTEALAQLADEEKAGQVPSNEDLRLLASAAAKLKDTASYVVAFEKMAIHYPNDQVWADLLRRVQIKPSFSPRLQLDFYRLMSTVMSTIDADDYYNLADMAMSAGFFSEAKRTLEAGYAAGVLGTGAGAAVQKTLRDRVNKAAADDVNTIASGEASAAKSKDGIGLVNLGYAYVTMDQFDKGIEFMKQGIAKGALKRPDDAKLHLGVALAKAGRKDEALQVLDTVKGNDGLGELARYWSLWLKSPMKTAPAPVAAK